MLGAGIAWLVLGQMPSGDGGFAPPSPSPMMPLLLALHGSAAVAGLLLAGALAPLHLRPAWRSGRNRRSGLPTLAAGAVLIGTTPLLYYAGSEALRGWAGDLHIAAGLVLPVALCAHRRGAG
jgi:hypothetical protein